LLSYAAVPVLAALAPAAAEADFIGPYAVGNWTTTTTPASDGSVDTSLEPASITLISSNNGISGSTDFTIAAQTAGIWEFDWSYTSGDTGAYDQGGFLLNGAFTLLACNDSACASGGQPDPQAGSISIPVNSGDIIGFRVLATDAIFGPGFLTISNFDAPTATSVPEPTSLALLALGSVGLALIRSRRKKQDS
jgi:hypothetical protein